MVGPYRLPPCAQASPRSLSLAARVRSAGPADGGLRKGLGGAGAGTAAGRVDIVLAQKSWFFNLIPWVYNNLKSLT